VIRTMITNLRALRVIACDLRYITPLREFGFK